METKINPNQADVSDLTRIKGIGTKLAERIIAQRPYESMQDLERVKGVGSANLKQWLDVLTLEEEAAPALIQTTEPDNNFLPLDEIPADNTTPDLAFEPVVSQDDQSVELLEIDSEPIMDEPTPAAEMIEPFYLPEQDVFQAELPPSHQAVQDSGEQVPAQEAEPDPVPPTPGIKKIFTRSQVLLIAGIGSLLAFLLAVGLILGLIAGLNQGRLRFASPAEVMSLTAAMESLSSRLVTQENDLLALQTRVESLETLNERMNAVEENVDSLVTDLADLNTQIGSLEDELVVIRKDITDLQSQTSFFTSFFESMRDLLVRYFPEP